LVGIVVEGESWGWVGVHLEPDNPTELSRHQAQKELADAYESVIDNLWPYDDLAPWPLCPKHGDHPLQPRLVRDVASWACRQDDATGLARRVAQQAVTRRTRSRGHGPEVWTDEGPGTPTSLHLSIQSRPPPLGRTCHPVHPACCRPGVRGGFAPSHQSQKPYALSPEHGFCVGVAESSGGTRRLPRKNPRFGFFRRRSKGIVSQHVRPYPARTGRPARCCSPESSAEESAGCCGPSMA
jgi:hypothetical protein